MPSIKSSSKTGDELVLFANEKRAIQATRATCDWIAVHASDSYLSDFAQEASDVLRKLIERNDAIATGKTVSVAPAAK